MALFYLAASVLAVEQIIYSSIHYSLEIKDKAAQKTDAFDRLWCELPPLPHFVNTASHASIPTIAVDRSQIFIESQLENLKLQIVTYCIVFLVLSVNFALWAARYKNKYSRVFFWIGCLAILSLVP